jgi:hypothetical protein
MMIQRCGVQHVEHTNRACAGLQPPTLTGFVTNLHFCGAITQTEPAATTHAIQINYKTDIYPTQWQTSQPR